MFVGAAVPRHPIGLPSPIVRGDSEETLVDRQESSSTAGLAVAMDVDSTLDIDQVDVKPLKATPTTDCHARRHREAATVPSTIPRNTCSAAAPLRVSVESYPKPRAPVVTACNLDCPGGHEWIIPGANKTSRRYFCPKCCITIQEKKRDGYWVHDKMTLSKLVSSDSPPPRRSSVRTTDSPNPDGANALSAISERDERASAGHDGDPDAMCIYESAAEDEPAPSPRPPLNQLTSRRFPRRSSGGRSSLDTAHSDAPSSLVGLPPLRRLPARAGADVSTPIGRLRQVSSSSSRRVSGNTPIARRIPSSPAQSDLASVGASSTPSSPESTFVLVAENPKPRVPVAGGYPSVCQGTATHKWMFKHANGTHRQYRCTVCDYLAKEKKHGSPEIWVPA
ncbi:hypothetical protein C8Q80DRAFT_599900 [Daedaleopsis nitida]|nr:hypothetical protein C8Q80DRAFT_599900 [Daedaleopsis nitida]